MCHHLYHNIINEGWGNVNKVKLIADSTCDLSADLIARHDIHVIPLYVTLSDESRRDGVNLTVPEVFAYTNQTKTTPKTAAVTIMDYIEAFKPYLEQGREIVYVGISSKMSSSFANAVIAAQELGGTIEVVDSQNLSTGIGLLLMMAGELADHGLGAAAIAQRLRQEAPNVRASFIIDTLLYLYRGGRCSALQAFGANALQIKPQIVVADGAMKPDRKYRGNFVRCAERYAADVLASAVDPDPARVFITYSPSEPEIVDAVKAAVEASGLFREILLTNAGCVISSHCGPNTIGVLYMEK
jgi:DegV family protein with EDD domain